MQVQLEGVTDHWKDTVTSASLDETQRAARQQPGQQIY
jgi:hypothetical protein